jgi:hypothetical protein
MVSISELNRRERDVRQSIGSLEKRFKENKISKADYDSMRGDKEKELKKIELERKSVISKLPPIPPPPKPSKTVLAKPAPTGPSEMETVQMELKKQGKDILFTQSEVSKLFGEVVRNRESIKGMESEIKEIGSARGQTAKVDMGPIERKVSSEIERMNAAVIENARKSKEELDRVLGDMRGLKNELGDLKKIRDFMEKMDLSGLRRDIESLKAKSGWMEKQMENLDLEPLYELIKEVEGRVSSSRGTGPIIIE